MEIAWNVVDRNTNCIQLRILPSGNFTKLLKMTIYSWFTHWKGWFSLIFHSYASLPEGNIKTAFQGLLLWFQNLPATSYWTYRPHVLKAVQFQSNWSNMVKLKHLNSGKLLQSTPSLIRLVAWKHIIIVWIVFKKSMESPQGIHKISQWLELLKQSAVLQKANGAEKCATHICTYLL